MHFLCSNRCIRPCSVHNKTLYLIQEVSDQESTVRWHSPMHTKWGSITVPLAPAHQRLTTRKYGTLNTSQSIQSHDNIMSIKNNKQIWMLYMLNRIDYTGTEHLSRGNHQLLTPQQVSITMPTSLGTILRCNHTHLFTLLLINPQRACARGL